MLYILRIEAEVSPRLGSTCIHMDARGFFVGSRGICWVLGTSTVCCDVPEGVAYPGSKDLVWLASVGETSLLASAGAFIVGATGRSYLKSLLPLWLTMLSYFSTLSVVLGVRRAFCLLQLWRVGLTHVGMTSSDSSSSIRIVPSPGSGGMSIGEPEASSSGASSGPPSPIDTRVLRDLEVMKAGHDLDKVVTEGSLAAIREQDSILIEYRLYVPQLGQLPYSSDVSG
ncbi:hypothetical protein GW17_00059214, partial [Ensete ventricosum]